MPENILNQNKEFNHELVAIRSNTKHFILDRIEIISSVMLHIVQKQLKNDTKKRFLNLV